MTLFVFSYFSYFFSYFSERTESLCSLSGESLGSSDTVLWEAEDNILMLCKGPSTLATLFSHMWPRIVADPSTLGRHVCYVCQRSVCGGDEPQPVAHLSHKLQCARLSLKIMVSYGNKYPRHNARPHVVEQSGQCSRALRRNMLIMFLLKIFFMYPLF